MPILCHWEDCGEWSVGRIGWRREGVAAGVGRAPCVGVDGQVGTLFQTSRLVLPAVSGVLTVPSNARQDNLTATVVVAGRTDSRRLPLGTR